MNVVKKTFMNSFKKSQRNMLKQNTPSKIIAVLKRFKLPYKRVRKGCRKLYVIKRQNIVQDKCEMFKNNTVPIGEKHKIKQQQNINLQYRVLQ